MKVHYLILPATLLMVSAAERFDHLVREDFFAGFAGNAERLEMGMQKTETALKENPNHAEALVWHGGGLFYQSNRFFQKQDFAKGMELFQKGVAEMARAVELEPKNIGVRVPRAATLAGGARFLPPQMAKPLFDMILDDYYTVYEMQKDHLDELGAHPKGELLFGLADINSRVGNTDKADYFYKLINDKMPGTPYAKRAAKWFETRQPLPPAQTQCIGCHTGK
jgi:tetratricopeptide (TPR) repeat protein